MSDGIDDGNVTSPPLQRDEAEMREVYEKCAMLLYDMAGIEFSAPWLGDLDDGELARYEALSAVITTMRTSIAARVRRKTLEEIAAKKVPGYYYDALHAMRCEHGWLKHECATCLSQRPATVMSETRTASGGGSPQAGEKDGGDVLFDGAGHMRLETESELRRPIPAADPLDRAVTYRALIETIRNLYPSVGIGNYDEYRGAIRLADALERAGEGGSP